LTDNNISFSDLDVARDDKARQEMVTKSQGKMVVPVVDIDGEVRVGYDEGWMKAKLGI
jgi:glutaredoxin